MKIIVCEVVKVEGESDGKYIGYREKDLNLSADAASRL
jgi:hypothetical protein